uniref:ATP-binding protein n=1 Tax=Paractinoplanes polyasparticus TaxID=2856853 RepID=UPI001C86563F|nr:BTAD domain-containing putative transcriptional regulator [Actinoplanes polyasparticus]
MVSDGQFDYRVLGPLETLHDGVAFSVGGPRHRALVVALLLRPNTIVAADRLAEALWEQPPPRWKELLYGRISEVRLAMRRAAGRPATELETHTAGYLLRVRPDALDAELFERLVTAGLSAARAERHSEAADRQRQALALWRGSALTELAHLSEAATEIARLDELRMRSIEARIDADLAVGRHHEVTPELVALVAEHPLNERLWEQLMLARYRAGQVGDALATFDAARHQLDEQLGVEPGAALRRLRQQILQQDPSLASRPPARRSSRSLPRPLTSFVGRDPELTALRNLLGAQRLVTVTGVGGAGKSRLAMEVAARAGAQDTTVWWCELAALTQPDLLADTIGDTLGVPSHSTRPRLDLIKEHLHGSDGLLILDNCEHLVNSVADFVNEVLAACPGLRVLATSRERLGVTGEVLLPLSGLSQPTVEVETPEAVGQGAAARLFVMRAQAADPAFALTDETAAAVATLCRGLDGLPLAIELAAAHANAFSVTEMAARLDDRFAFFGAVSRTVESRHRTLQAVIDWSFRLLDADERRFFARLSVFAGEFELTWAEQLNVDLFAGDRIAGLIAALVDKSLLLREAGRYRMLETLRAYGTERLADQNELDTARNRHAALMARLADELGAGYVGAGRRETVRLLGAAMEQFRAAMDWAVASDDAETALRIASALAIYWHITGRYAVGRRWLQQALNSEGEALPPVRAQALSGLVALTTVQADLTAASAAAEEAAAIFEQAGDVGGYRLVLRRLATAEAFAGNLERAEQLLVHLLTTAQDAEPWLRGWALTQLGLVSAFRGDWVRTAQLAAEAEQLLFDVGDPEVLAYVWLLRAEVARQTVGPTAGVDWLCKALRLLDRESMRWSITIGLHYAALVYESLGRTGHELVLLSAGHELRRQTGGAFFSDLLQHQEERVAQLSQTLDAETFGVRWEAGRKRPVSEVIAEVCRELTGLVPGPSAPTPSASGGR